jgi:dinuclear metal center YbgI/SA1388 family protein
MSTIQQIASFLGEFAPSELAADWDNTGLLVGDSTQGVQRVMTCLTVTPTSAGEAIEAKADLIVTHHPLPFRAMKRLTAETTTGRMLLDLIGAGIGVYSPHTAFDSAPEGINQQLAEGLGAEGIQPLVAREEGGGNGRWGRLASPTTLAGLAKRVKNFLSIDRVQIVGPPDQSIHSLAVACGAAGEYLEAARQAGCDGMLIGETRFHTCLEAEALGIGLVLPGHYASERFAVENLAVVLAQRFPDLTVWASRKERDPIRFV